MVEPAVLVHCNKGVSRSAAIVIAYIMREKKLLYKEALAIVRKERESVFPNSGFAAQLRTWEKRKYDIHDEHGKKSQRKDLDGKAKARTKIVQTKTATGMVRQRVGIICSV